MSKPLGSRFGTISSSDKQKLQDEWMSLWHQYGVPEGGMAELWYHAVLNFLETRGDLVYPAELLRTEEKLISQGLSAELFSALNEVVSPELGGENDEERRIMELIRASPEDRKQAIQELRALGGNK